jgi:uncharacterized protein with PQ loop repeat
MKKGLEPSEPGPLVGRLVYLAAFIGPLSVIPQVAEIWFVDHNAKGVSLVTWLSFTILSMIWLIYGLQRRDRPLIISNALWVVGELIVVAGAIHYDFDFL